MHAFLPLLFALASSTQLDPMRAQQWLSLELGQVSRSMPLADPIGDAVNPSLQLSYHRNVLGSSALGAGLTFQAGTLSYDELLFAASLGTGIEATLRLRFGLFAAFGLRLDYARAFTGSNNFELEGGSYRQQTDWGRSFLRITPVDLSIGYSPRALQRLGLIPALRVAWLLDAPLYESDGANPWSYTVLGMSVLWTWEGRR
jgi:hypothetical protein